MTPPCSPAREEASSRAHVMGVRGFRTGGGSWPTGVGRGRAPGPGRGAEGGPQAEGRPALGLVVSAGRSAPPGSASSPVEDAPALRCGEEGLGAPPGPAPHSRGPCLPALPGRGSVLSQLRASPRASPPVPATCPMTPARPFAGSRKGRTQPREPGQGRRCPVSGRRSDRCRPRTSGARAGARGARGGRGGAGAVWQPQPAGTTPRW